MIKIFVLSLFLLFQTFQEYFDKADIVFAGRVEDVMENRVTFAVTREYKGNIGKTITVKTGRNDLAKAKKGDLWIVYSDSSFVCLDNFPTSYWIKSDTKNLSFLFQRSFTLRTKPK